ncbi:hypothetical protein GCM10025875_28290 [Litorihabitans aurantiacus]|uniref:Uncharacterized protein n=2 Tax=Litorihabitans aurantiacus TaxID=1930061 RepID=A0AA37XGJ4_9MICO|nr:hypothetical protein GCM10025875_28290 [Litorihabitans aurantiacus]
MRAALLNTQAQTGVRGLSDLIARACLAELERLECLAPGLLAAVK